jgi:hypothetical protein
VAPSIIPYNPWKGNLDPAFVVFARHLGLHPRFYQKRLAYFSPLTLAAGTRHRNRLRVADGSQNGVRPQTPEQVVRPRMH